MQLRKSIIILSIFLLGFINFANGQIDKKKNPLNQLNEKVLRSNITKKIHKAAGLDVESEEYKRVIDVVSGSMGTGDHKKAMDNFQKHLSDRKINYNLNKNDKVNGTPLWKIRNTIKKIIRTNNYSYSFFQKYYYPEIEKENGYENGMYLLHYAVKNGEKLVAKLIIDRGFPIDKRCWTRRNSRIKGKTALETAARDSKNARIIKFLLDNGASTYHTKALDIAIRFNNYQAIDYLWPELYNSTKAIGLLTAFEYGNSKAITNLTKRRNPAPYYKKYLSRYIKGCVTNLRKQGMRAILYQNIDRKIFKISDVVFMAFKENKHSLINKFNNSDYSLNIDQLKSIFSNSHFDIDELNSAKQILYKSVTKLNEKDRFKLAHDLCYRDQYELLYIVKNTIGAKYIKDSEINRNLTFYPIVRTLIVNRTSFYNFILTLAEISQWLVLLLYLLPIILYWIITRRKTWAKILITILYIFIATAITSFINIIIFKEIYELNQTYLTIIPCYIGAIWIMLVSMLKVRKIRRRKKILTAEIN